MFSESIKTIQEEKALLEAASTEEKEPSFWNEQINPVNEHLGDVILGLGSIRGHDKNPFVYV